MTGAPAGLTDLVRPISADAHVTAAVWLADVALFALGDGSVLIVDDDNKSRVVPHPDGAILTAVGDRTQLITGGDDGRVCAVARDGRIKEIAHESGRWIDAVAVSRAGAIAWSAGRNVRARDAKGAVRTMQAPSTVRGLAFAPKGYRVALAHQNGASLWFPNTDAPPDTLAWKGSHIDVTVSPDGRFLVTSMQENALHGWRLADRRDMRMSGYPTRPRSFSWSADGLWLATSGADAALAWPFDGKDGPMGRAPQEAGIRKARVTQVAFHPKVAILLAGYEDGTILLIRLRDGHELAIRPAGPGGPVTALAWNVKGTRLAFGCEDGAAGTLALPDDGRPGTDDG